MLQRYLITNAISTAILYAAVLAGTSALSSLPKLMSASADIIVVGDVFLAPIVHGMITVSAGVFGVF